MPPLRKSPSFWATVVIVIIASATSAQARAAVDIDGTFERATSVTSIPDWTYLDRPNPGGDIKEDSATLMDGGPLGSRYMRFLLDNGYKVGSSSGERVDVIGHWGIGAASRGLPEHHDAEVGTESWYIEAFRVPVGFVAGPTYTVISEWHGNSANWSKPIYMQAPWHFMINPHLGTLYYNVWLNTGKQFANAGTQWEIDGWNTNWGSTEPSDELRVPTTNTRGTPSPHGNPMWLAPVDFGKWQYFLYRIRWRNDWSGVFECWTRTQDESSWHMVANYHNFPTRVYQDGDLNTNLYAVGAYYRSNGGIRQSLDYGGRARSNSVADASLGTVSTGFQELAALARYPAPPGTDPGGSGGDPSGGGGPTTESPSAEEAPAMIARVHVRRRGQVVARVRGLRGTKVDLTARTHRGRLLSRTERRIGDRGYFRYRIRLLPGRHRLQLGLRAELGTNVTRSRMRVRLAQGRGRIAWTSMRSDTWSSGSRRPAPPARLLPVRTRSGQRLVARVRGTAGVTVRMVARSRHGSVLADQTRRIRGNGRLRFPIAVPPSPRGGIRVRISAQQHTDAARINVKLRRSGGKLRPVRRVARYTRVA